MKAICHSFQLLSKIHFPPEKQMIAILFQLVVSAIHSQFVLTRRKELQYMILGESDTAQNEKKS